MSDWLFIIGVLFVCVSLGAIHWYLGTLIFGAFMIFAAVSIQRRAQHVASVVNAAKLTGHNK